MNVKTLRENRSADLKLKEAAAPGESLDHPSVTKSITRRIAEWIGVVVGSRHATEEDYIYLKAEFQKMMEDGSLDQSLDAFSSAVPKR